MKAIFLGGDIRQKYACEFLNKNNIFSECFMDFFLDNTIKRKIGNADILVLPIPLMKDSKNIYTSNDNSINIYEIINLINSKSKIYGGNFTEELKEYFTAHKISYVDYFDMNYFQINNAFLSAEGAIYYAKERLEKSLYGLDVAILGLGRIGKILAFLLHSHGAKITICTRKESDFVWSKLIGFNSFKINFGGNVSNLDLINDKFDLIINTIPSWIMNENFIRKMDYDTVIIDVASYPYGIDESLAERYKLKYYRELKIPGRYAPKSAGEIIGQTIINTINNAED